MKTLLLTACLALAACGTDTEKVRSDLEQKVAVAQVASSTATVLFTMYDSLPVCGGVEPLCKKPDIAEGGKLALAALRSFLADAQLALAEGLSDEERIGLLTAALIKAAQDVNAIIKAIEAPDAVDSA